MKQTSLPSFSTIASAFSKAKMTLHPSQVHGLICGFLCANHDKETAWEKLISTQNLLTSLTEILKQLHDITAKQLEEFLFELQLLLPSDGEDLAIRAEALTLWVQGFLTGLQQNNVPVTNRAPSEVTETINDLIEITKMNYEEVVANEEDEAAYTELEEYVRMAVILIYQDMHEESHSEQESSSAKQLH